MTIHAIMDQLFPRGHSIGFEGDYFCGSGETELGTVSVIGSIDATPIGVEMAFRMAADVLDVVRFHPKRPILLMVDTQGQRLSRRDELMGINAYMAHLAKSLDLARRKGHRIIGLVWSQAVSGGFLATSLLADECYALADAEIRVMNLPAMSRVTKIPLEQLQALSHSSPVFAPGVDNYVRMGAIKEIWSRALDRKLVEALSEPASSDKRREWGQDRGGRLMAHKVAGMVQRDES